MEGGDDRGKDVVSRLVCSFFSLFLIFKCRKPDLIVLSSWMWGIGEDMGGEEGLWIESKASKGFDAGKWTSHCFGS